MGNSKGPKEIENSHFKPKWENGILIFDWIVIVLLLVFTVIFCWNQSWHFFNGTIDTDKWGTFGDFIGGLLGTAVAYVSLRLLVRNLKEQENANLALKESNDRNSEVSELQLVHENVSTLLDSYKRVLDNYKIDEKKGLAVIKEIANSLYVGYQAENKTLQDGIDAARINFESKYIEYRDCMAVHYRLLYQIFQIIWRSDLRGEKKAMLSKMMRSQFTEDELLLLRYNCLTTNGEKMRQYVNQFNLLKHLPLSHLLEFKQWTCDLKDIQRNRLDTECVKLRKQIKNLIFDDSTTEQENVYSDKYRCKLKLTLDKKNFQFEIVCYTDKDSSNDKTSIDKVFDKWKDDGIKDFFVAYFSYVFDFSNFSQFNKMSDITVSKDVKTEENGRKHIVCISFKKEKSKLIVSMPQNLDPK